jgi:hypothetical protein
VNSKIDGAALLGDLMAFLGMYVVTTLEERLAICLWCIHTHAFEAAEATPYLSVTSPEKQSGKSKLLETLELLVRAPWLAVAIAPATLYRKVEKDQPTLLLDESDAAFHGDKERAEAVRELLNASHRRGVKVPRCVGQGSKIDVAEFAVFCPKAIAGIGLLPDTVSDRAIPIRLRRKSKDEFVHRFRRREVEKDARQLRERVSQWAHDHIAELIGAQVDTVDELSDRAFDCWEPLFAIADIIGGEYQTRARQAAVSLHTGNATEDQSVGVRLLGDIRRVYDSHDADRLRSVDMVADLNSFEESGWAESQHGRPLTPTAMAKLLRPFGIRRKTAKFEDNTPAKGYLAVDFADAWSRYLPPAFPTPPKIGNLGNNGVATGVCDDFKAVTTHPGLPPENGPKPLFDGLVTEVTAKTGGRGTGATS